MIDYEYWFRNTRDIQIDDQVRRVASGVVVPFAGRIHPFVPFDPVRELAWRQGLPRPDDPAIGPAEHVSSLALVKDAVLRRGFIGVKLYNSLGYRPLGNAEVDDARRRHFRKIGRPRYCRFSGGEIDAVLDELYAFCVANQVPIVAHCGSDGIEAYPGRASRSAAPSNGGRCSNATPGCTSTSRTSDGATACGTPMPGSGDAAPRTGSAPSWGCSRSSRTSTRTSPTTRW